MLANLFSVELWERFSFYGMQIVVLLYMYFEVGEGGLGIDQDVAVGIIGAYGGLVYLSTIVGAWSRTGCSAPSGSCSTAAA
jgi:POT family proton-dependent oligopeptide transporter